MKVSTKWTTVTPLSKAFAMALFVLLPFIGLWLGFKYSSIKMLELNSQLNLLKNSKGVSENTPNQLQPEQVLGIYPSPSGKHLLVMRSSVNDQGKCVLNIFNSKGYDMYTFNAKNLLGSDTFPCQVGMFKAFSDSFLGWASDEKLVFETNKGTLSIVSLIPNQYGIDDFSVSKLTYDSNTYNIQPPNGSAKIFLFYKKQVSSEEGKFVFIDLENNAVIKELSFNIDTSFGPFYDYINDGYILTQRVDQEDKVVTDIFFIDMKTLNLTKVLHNEPIDFPGGRGCGPIEVESVTKGEIIFYDGGCLTLDKEKYSSDGLLHMEIEK